MPNDKSDGLGFRLAHGGGGHGAAVARVQKFMRRFMDQTDQILGGRLAGKNGNPIAVAHAKSGRYVFVVFKGDVLRIKKGNQTVAVFAHFAGNVVLELGQVRAFSLCHIEDIHGAKANQHGRSLGVVVLLAALVAVVLRAPLANHRGENLNPFLATLYKAAKLFPRMESGNVGCSWALQSTHTLRMFC